MPLIWIYNQRVGVGDLVWGRQVYRRNVRPASFRRSFDSRNQAWQSTSGCRSSGRGKKLTLPPSKVELRVIQNRGAPVVHRGSGLKNPPLFPSITKYKQGGAK